MFKNFWYAIEFSEAITEQPHFFQIGAHKLVLYRTSDRVVHAMSNRCVHRGGSLAQGTVVDNCLVCPYHGWHYNSDGACVKIPSNLPNAKIPIQAKMPTYSIKEKDGWVWLFLGEVDRAEQTPIPDIPHFHDQNLRSIHGEFHWQVNYERAIENGLDFAHAPFVHAGAFGNPDTPEVGNLEIEQSEWGASATVFLKPSPPKGLWRFLAKADRADVKTCTGFLMPNLTFLEVFLPFGSLVIWTAHIPIDEYTTVSKWMNFRSFFTGKWADGDAYRRTIKIFQQDRPIVEAQSPQVIPFDLTAEIHVQADALQLQYRQLRRQLVDMGCLLGMEQD